MSAPFKNYSSLTHGILCELMSGMSALNMEPSPLADPDGPFIVDTDSWVKHSAEHFNEAIGLSQKVSGAFSTLSLCAEMLIIKLRPDLYSMEWSKMTDVDRANAIAKVLNKMSE